MLPGPDLVRHAAPLCPPVATGPHPSTAEVTVLRYTLEVPADGREVAAARLWAAGATGVQETDAGLIAWFPRRVEGVPPGGSWRTEPQRDWLSEWRRGLQPVRVGEVIVAPSWDVPSDASAEVIVIDPGMAFGTGHHATTRRCLAALQAIALRDRAVLDVGTGTGVLAIAAARRGARGVVAVDTDADAIRTARANVRANGVEVDVRLGSFDAVAGAEFDVVVANLVTGLILGLLPDLLSAARRGGTLVMSGIAVERAGLVRDALVAAGATPVDEDEEDGWTAMVARA